MSNFSIKQLYVLYKPATSVRARYRSIQAREDKGEREGIPHTHPTPQVIRLELFLESG